MVRVLQSRLFAWVALIFVIVVLILTFALRIIWWEFIDIFCAFMAAFCHLVAVYVSPKLPAIGAQMEKTAGWFCILFIAAFIVEFILNQIFIK